MTVTTIPDTKRNCETSNETSYEMEKNGLLIEVSAIARRALEIVHQIRIPLERMGVATPQHVLSIQTHAEYVLRTLHLPSVNARMSVLFLETLREDLEVSTRHLLSYRLDFRSGEPATA